MEISTSYSSSILDHVKTGTTILGMIVENGNAIIIAADSRATMDHVVAEKACMKLHKLASNIYCGGAGTAADLEHASCYIQTKLNIHRLTTGRIPTVKTAVTMYKRHLFQYGGHIGCYLTVGGYDHTGAHLYCVDATGLTFETMYVAEGSGKIGCQPILTDGWRANMTREEGVALATEGILGGIYNDMGSGGRVNLLIIDKNGVEERLCISNPNTRKFRNPQFNGFPKQLQLLSCETVKFEREEEEQEVGNDERLMELE